MPVLSAGHISHDTYASGMPIFITHLDRETNSLDDQMDYNSDNSGCKPENLDILKDKETRL